MLMLLSISSIARTSVTLEKAQMSYTINGQISLKVITGIRRIKGFATKIPYREIGDSREQ